MEPINNVWGTQAGPHLEILTCQSQALRNTILNSLSLATMHQEILNYIPRYGVIICTLRKEPHCISLRSIGKHYSTFHSDSISPTPHAALVKYAWTLKNELMDPKQVKLIVPPFEEGPIDGLHKIHGYRCTECKKLLSESYSMEQHCRLHGWTKEKRDMWDPKMYASMY